LLPLVVESLATHAFRNLEKVEISLSPAFNVFFGDNGQGKTNLLEAVYVLATSKSFRTAKLGEIVAHGSDTAGVRARLREGDDLREQSLGLRGAARAPKIDGKRPRSLFEYAVKSPVVVFHPGEVALSMGPSAERRKLLDRVSVHLEPGLMREHEAYRRALRERQRALETRGVSARDLPDWEALVVDHGLRVSKGRARAVDELSALAVDGFSRIGTPGVALDVTYAPAQPNEPDAFRAALEGSRSKDLSRGSATVGPHRDDLRLVLGGHVAKGTASQGQHRAIVLALKSAEIEVITRARGVRPVLLLDDVSSELDASRTEALFRFLGAHEGQVLLTTTRPELIAVGTRASRKDFRVEAGRVTVV
jgi:DNA replication and repair protein RecF